MESENPSTHNAELPNPELDDASQEFEYIPNFDIDQYEHDYYAEPTNEIAESQEEQLNNQIPTTSAESLTSNATKSVSQESDTLEYIPNFDIDQYEHDYYAEPTNEIAENQEEQLNNQIPTTSAESSTSNAAEPISQESDPPEYIPNFDVEPYNSELFMPLNDDKPKITQKPETQKIKRKIREQPKTPINAIPPPDLDVHAQFSMKILKTQAITPMPNYASMLDEELNDHLDKFGLRPMGRRLAIETLTRVYEATHPVIDEATTPTRGRIWSTIHEYAGRPIKKPAASRKRPAPAEFNQITLPASKPQTLESITSDVLRWLRMPRNAELYGECMALKTIMLERLLEAFNPLLREKAISKDVFTRILDHLHITYSDKRDENCQYYY